MTPSAPRLYLFFVAFFSLAMTMTAPEQWRLWRVAQAPEQARGVVTAVSCGRSGHVDYVFKVGTTTYFGPQRYVKDVCCSQLRLGQPVNVSYERGAPQNNFAFSPDNNDDDRAAKAFDRVVMGTILLIFAAPMALVLVGAAVRRALPGARRSTQS